jgi:hypothetical protein
MGFDITDLANPERTVSVNFWNWRPTVEIIREAGLLDVQRLDGLHQQFSGTRITTDEARAIASHLRAIVLPSLTSGARVLIDGTSTTEPDDGTFHRDPSEVDRNYSASRSWLEMFATFCESCSGFEFN